MRPLRTSWKSTPGNFDPNHLLQSLSSDNDWGIPQMRGVTDPVHVDWSLLFDLYRSRVRGKKDLPSGTGLITFFTADYRFECLWSSPDRFLSYMTPDHWSLTPDFSLYTDHPPAVHLWNIFRSRWLGAYWQREGLQVIPTVSWATPSSYDYCFLGLPHNAVLAVSTVGVLKNKETRSLWEQGFSEMVARLTPVQVLCCGAMPRGFSTSVPLMTLTPFQAKFGV